MAIIYYDPGMLRLRKYAASSTRAGGKTTSVVRIEFASSDPYAVASILSQLEEAEREQQEADRAAKRTSSAPARRSRSLPRIEGAEAPLMLPYHGDGK